MKKSITPFLLLIAGLWSQGVQAQNQIPTTTVTGALNVNDSLRVTRNINSAGDITATGEMVARDTMRAQKDIIVTGNAVIGGNLNVEGMTNLNNLNVSGSLVIADQQMQFSNPCGMSIMAAVQAGNNTVQLSPINSISANALDFAMDASPCPAPPVIPFTWQTYGNHVNSNNRWIGTIENYDFNIRTNSIPRLIIKNNGQMFFGSKKVNANHQHANSMYQFDGKIACKELVVIDPTKWADFVFEKNYKLLPLNDLETFYRKNNHLPDVPSEKEVKENGINTAEMDAILLQKIEELTLYIVQQQKEIEALKKEIKK